MTQTYEEKVIDMAVNNWLDQDLKFPVGFRFTLDSKAFKLKPWVAAADYSVKPKRLGVRLYEVILKDGTNPVMNYLALMGKDNTTNTDHFSLKYYDGEGKVLRRLEFDRCALQGHAVEFNYGNQGNNTLLHNLEFSYENMKFYRD